MSASLKIVRVSELPASVNRNTLYLVDTANPTVFDIYLSSNDGSITERSFSSQDVSLMIAALKNQPNGIAGLDSNGLIPSSILPSYVDDVLEYATFASLPVTGEAGKIYLITNDNSTYRWGGSSYFNIAGGNGTAASATKLTTARNINGVPFDGTADITVNAVDSTARIAVSEKGANNGVATLGAGGIITPAQLPAYVASINTRTGAVTLTKSDVGLANVDNTADTSKPVSTAQQTAINAAQANAIAASAPVAHVGSGGTSHAVATTTVAGFMSSADKTKLDAISGTNTGDETAATIRSKLGITTLSGSNTGDQTTITGNAGSATVLQTARLINGVSFNGSANITINAVDATARIASSEKGANNGVATLDGTGKVPTSQLPSFVDDVLEYADFAALPTTGETGKIYVALDNNRTYRWSGSAYVQITSGAVDSVAGKTGAVTLVKADVGLANVDNTADTAKPVSTAQQTAIDNAQANAIAASAPSAHVGSGGTAHSVATVSSAGFMSNVDKTKLDAITGSNTGDETAVTIRAKLGITTLSGTNTGDQTSVTGNAGTATILQTSRNINGVAFNGSADITVSAVDTVTPRLAASLLGANNGVASLDATGKVPSSQLPSFVDDVLEAANLAAFPVTGEAGKIYVALDTNKTYRWSGSVYVQITSGAVDSVAGKTGIVTLVKADVGLGNVDNTSDASKPVSTAQQTAINTAQSNAIAASAPIAHVGSGGTSHASATTTVAGFMAAADKLKLDGISGTNTGDETVTTIRTKLGITTLSGSNTGDETNATILSKLGIASISGVNTGDQTNITGNAGTATKLATSRLINGVSFDGTADITINAVDTTARVAVSALGANNGVATLDATGKVPTAQLPSFVDDVLESTNFAALPATGETGKIYVTLDNNRAYRWSGSAYVQITSGAVDSVAGKTGAVTLTKGDVGLGNVDNTADTAKPVSTAQQTAINTAQSNAIAASTPAAHAGSGGTAHAVATTTVAGFMSSSDKTKLDAITGTNTGDETTATIRSKLGITTLSGSNTGDQTSVTGNAGTATTLQTARNINGVSFNGSADITINAVDATARLASSLLGVANGVASLDATGKVPTAQLPAFVDDVLEYANLAGFPGTGETAKIYVALDTNLIYRWTGSAYVSLGSAGGGVTSVAGKTGIVTLVKGDVGLANVDNTADTAKPVSTAQQTAINTAQSNAIAASAPIAHVGSGGTAHANVTTTVAGFMTAADKVKLDAITGTNTGDETTATIRSKLGITTLSGSNTGDQTSVTGNAGTATTLQTARLINGVSFNGSADITINAVDSTARVASSLLGAVNGVATLDGTGKVPTAQLPAFVDDVLEFTNLAAFPGTGETAKIYVALDTNLIYRWTGSAYVTLGSSGGGGGVTSVAGKTGIVTLVKADVGLDSVDNTADSAKPVSTAQQAAINLMVPLTQKAAANGVATLDAGSKLPSAQIPIRNYFAAIAAATGTTLMQAGNVSPVATEGTQIATITATPMESTSKVYISGAITVSSNTAARRLVLAAFKGTTLIGAIEDHLVTANTPQLFHFTFYDPFFGLAGITTPVTYNLRVGLTAAGTWYVNRNATVTLNGAVALNRSMRLEEVN